MGMPIAAQSWTFFCSGVRVVRGVVGVERVLGVVND